MAIIDRIKAIKHGKSLKINGRAVRRIGDDEYQIDGDIINGNKAVELLSEPQESADIYDRIAFVLCMPNGGIVACYRCKNKQQHNIIIEYAKSKKYYLYYADIVKVGESIEYATKTMSVEWATVPDIIDSVEKKEQKFECKACKIKFKSQSGYTLHMKAKH